MTAAKRRGAEAEIWPVEHALSLGIRAAHIRQTTGKSMPDIEVWLKGERYVIQCKARRNLSIGAVLRQAQEQAENYAEHLDLPEIPKSALLIRPYGAGRVGLPQWPLIQTFEQFLGC